MIDLYQTNTLRFNRELCNDCNMCIAVCPHAVFEKVDSTVYLVHSSNCMECGACQINCPTGAIRVDSGVGCAAAMIFAAIKGKKVPTCGSQSGHLPPEGKQGGRVSN